MSSLLRRRKALLSIYLGVMGTPTSQNREGSHRRLPSKLGLLSQPVEVCLPLGESVLANSSTLTNPSSLTLLFLQLIASVISASKCSIKCSLCSDECRQQSKIFYDTEKQADWSHFHEYCRTQGLKYPLLVKRLACTIISELPLQKLLTYFSQQHYLPQMILLVSTSGEYQHVNTDKVSLGTRGDHFFHRTPSPDCEAS
ncbi:hypothetical protein H5410_015607 [Solanum commersonii]|uniref:Uncharacterized protein n=1 Tax=Solanum commersonii TaxID=4109 RepID=A0A9J5ZV13_SOLCO|nr:hypothetical protein H5410_015607 [Solanum commersonii]